MTLPLEALLEGKYEILDKIAEGGIGSIYKVRHLLLEEIRVIKVLRSQVADRDDLHQRLLQEAKTAIRLEHPSIARLFDLTVADDGTAYIVMEFIDGVSLDSMLAANGPPSVELTLEVARQSLTALGYLHDCGFIHRDISPDNLMLTRDAAGRLRVKLIDLGIAKDLAQETGVTAVGTFLGKVKYCAPELFKDAGAKLLDQRSDNYSLAVTLYELLTGRHPFSGETFEELAAGHLFHPPTSFDDSDPDGRVPPALREIILGALAKDPSERPESAADFAAALGQFAIDEDQLAAEFERTVGATTRFLSKFQKYSSGSTQTHLNEQFGLQKTGVVDPEEAEPTIAGDSPTEDDTTQSVLTVVPSDNDGAAGGPTKRTKLLLALAATPLIAVGAWFALRPSEPAPVTGPATEPTTSIPVMAVDRFDPNAVSSVIDKPEVPRAFPEQTEPATGPSATTSPPSQPAAQQAVPQKVQQTKAAPQQPDPAIAATPELPVVLLKAGPGVVAPRLLAPIEPPYPKPDRKEVVVLLSVFVSHEGKVLTAVVRDGPAFKRRYREAAVAAAKQADFEPPSLNGVPGKMWVDVEVRFKP